MLRLIVLVLFVLTVLAVKFLNWWQLLIVGTVVILLSKFLARRMFEWLFTMPFRAKGKVLRNAAVEVHAIRVAPARMRSAPDRQARLERESRGDDDDDDDDTEYDGPRDYYEIEVTITPGQGTGSFPHWDIDDLLLGRPGGAWNGDDTVCIVESVHVVREGTVLLDKQADEDEDDDGSKVIGPQRLRMRIGVKPDVRELVFNYYFESFGRIDLTRASR